MREAEAVEQSLGSRPQGHVAEAAVPLQGWPQRVAEVAAPLQGWPQHEAEAVEQSRGSRRQRCRNAAEAVEPSLGWTPKGSAHGAGAEEQLRD
jgi:hypothetical protein